MATLTTITGGGAFTAQNIRNINSNFSALNSGSGGGSILHQASLTLDDEAIKALPSGGVTVVAAPALGSILIPTTLIYLLDTSGGAYSNISVPNDGSYLYLSWEAIDIDTGIQNAGSVVGMDTFLGNATTTLAYVAVPNIHASGSANWSPLFTAPSSGAMGKALTLDCFNADGPFDDGHADNTLTVCITYLILNTITGLFE